jgi:hypothetical protein
MGAFTVAVCFFCAVFAGAAWALPACAPERTVWLAFAEVALVPAETGAFLAAVGAAALAPGAFTVVGFDVAAAFPAVDFAALCADAVRDIGLFCCSVCISSSFRVIVFLQL